MNALGIPQPQAWLIINGYARKGPYDIDVKGKLGVKVPTNR